MLLLSEFWIRKHQIIKKSQRITQISQICEFYRTDLVAKEMRFIRTATQKGYQFYQSCKLWQSIGHKNDPKIMSSNKK